MGKSLTQAKPTWIDWDNLKVAPWERLPKESSQAFEAFRTYRDLGVTRSQREVAARLGKNVSTIREFAIRWHWTRRVGDWESYMDAIARQAQIDAIEEMNQRHARTAMAIITRVGQRLIGDEAAGIQAIDVNKLSASDVSRLFDVATKIERLARGAETDAVKVHGETEITVKLAFDPDPIYPQGPGNLEPPVIDAAVKRKELSSGDSPGAGPSDPLASSQEPGEQPPDTTEEES